MRQMHVQWLPLFCLQMRQSNAKAGMKAIKTLGRTLGPHILLTIEFETSTSFAFESLTVPPPYKYLHSLYANLICVDNLFKLFIQ